MKNLRFMRVGWVLVLVFIVAGVSVITPVLASNNTTRHTSYTARQAAGSSLNAIIYLTTGMLEPVFQSRIEQQVPVAFNNALTTMVSKLPSQDRGWAYEMASTLLQPSATALGDTAEPGPTTGWIGDDIAVKPLPGRSQGNHCHYPDQFPCSEFIHGTGQRHP